MQLCANQSCRGSGGSPGLRHDDGRIVEVVVLVERQEGGKRGIIECIVHCSPRYVTSRRRNQSIGAVSSLGAVLPSVVCLLYS
jgi:hypothetical protein